MDITPHRPPPSPLQPWGSFSLLQSPQPRGGPSGGLLPRGGMRIQTGLPSSHLQGLGSDFLSREKDPPRPLPPAGPLQARNSFSAKSGRGRQKEEKPPGGESEKEGKEGAPISGAQSQIAVPAGGPGGDGSSCSQLFPASALGMGSPEGRGFPS